jgi:hypothetical protein
MQTACRSLGKSVHVRRLSGIKLCPVVERESPEAVEHHKDDFGRIFLDEAGDHCLHEDIVL